MPDSASLQVKGLRDMLGRFAQYREHGIQQQRDELLRAMGVRLKDKLAEAAPRGKTSPHLADMFEMSPVRGDAAQATVTISNSKTVSGKSGTYSLLELVTRGTRPHAIRNAFGWGPAFGDWPTFHPGTRPNPFVRDVLKAFSPEHELQQFAGKAAKSLAVSVHLQE